MEFHQQQCAESFRDKLLVILFDKKIIKEEYNMEDIKNIISFDIESDSSDDDDDNEPVVKQETLFSDNISDEDVTDNNVSDEDVTDNNVSDNNVSDNNESVTDTEEPVTETTKKDKKSKKKKEKKEDTSSNTDDKPKRAKPSFVYFKSHPDVQEAIVEASNQLQGDDDKKPGEPVGKVKGAGIVWGNLSAEEKDVWKQRSFEEFKQTLNQ